MIRDQTRSFGFVSRSHTISTLAGVAAKVVQADSFKKAIETKKRNRNKVLAAFNRMKADGRLPSDIAEEIGA